MQNGAQSSAARSTHPRFTSLRHPRSTRASCLNAFRRSSATLTPISMEQLNSSDAQRGPSSLIGILVLSKFPQYKTERLCLLLAGQNVTRQNEHSNRKLNRVAKPRRHHHKLSPLMPRPPGHILLQVLPRYVQDPRIHALSVCCLISYFSLLCIPSTHRWQCTINTAVIARPRADTCHIVANTAPARSIAKSSPGSGADLPCYPLHVSDTYCS